MKIIIELTKQGDDIVARAIDEQSGEVVYYERGLSLEGAIGALIVSLVHYQGYEVAVVRIDR